MTGAGPVRTFLTLAAALTCLVCAKKMLPPSPDRFAPRLEGVRTKNRVRLELEFNEGIDPGKLVSDSFAVTGPDGTTLELRGVAGGRRRDRVEVWTRPQQPQPYEVHGVVWDENGNPGRFRARFLGSDRADTVAPAVTGVQPSAGATSRSSRQAIKVTFSEPVDTLFRPAYVLVPSFLDSAYSLSWQEDWQGVNIAGSSSPLAGTTLVRRPGVEADTAAPSDSVIGPQPIVYFVLLPGARDLEGNRMRELAFTYYTRDSLLGADLVHGRATWQHGPLGTGLVYFDADSTRGMAPILSDGSFSLRLRPGDYRAVAVSDTDGDRVADLRGGPVEFNTSAESLELELEPETAPRTIDAYRR